MSTAETPIDTDALVERFTLKALVESCLVLEEGVAAMKDIDLGMMAGAGIIPPPFARADRIGLDEVLAKLASRMRRETVAAGTAPVVEGDEGERFYVVLSGMLSVSQEAMGPRRVLKPGDYFGEVALAMEVPRTASVRALTPSVVASCDRQTFDEFVRPLFSD